MNYETAKDSINVKHKPNLGLIVVSTDAGKGEQTIMTLTPNEAFNLGSVLKDLGRQHGGMEV